MSAKIRSRDLKRIRSWIKRVQKKRYKPTKSVKKKAKRRLKLRYKVLGTGKKRIVYDLKNGYVLKVAMTTSGIKDTRKEARVYRSASSRAKKYLAKVKKAGTGWILMKRIRRKVTKSKSVKARLKRMQKRFKRKGLIARDLFTTNRRIRWANLRRKKGKIVVIDYGNFKIK